LGGVNRQGTPPGTLGKGKGGSKEGDKRCEGKKKELGTAEGVVPDWDRCEGPTGEHEAVQGGKLLGADPLPGEEWEKGGITQEGWGQVGRGKIE